VREFLTATFPGPGIGLSDQEGGSALVAVLADRGISGGASYDAVIAIVCQRAGVTLMTLDARARTTYERIGVAIESPG